MTRSTIYQLARAHQKVFMDGVMKLDEQTYHVQSATDSTKTYLVTKAQKGYECNCDGYMWRNHCSHITSIRIYRRNHE